MLLGGVPGNRVHACVCHAVLCSWRKGVICCGLQGAWLPPSLCSDVDGGSAVMLSGRLLQVLRPSAVPGCWAGS